MIQTSIQTLGQHLASDYDIALFSGSYEPRSLVCPRVIPRKRYRHAIISWNRNHAEYNTLNFNAIKSFCEGAIVQTCDLDSDDPVKTADAFLEALNNAGVHEALRIIVDVTAFTREALAILLRLLRILSSERCVLTIIYSAARRYNAKGNKPWLSSGIREVRSVLGYSGALAPSMPSHLIVLPGYENERAGELIASYEPRLLSIGTISKAESISDEIYEIHREFMAKLVAVYERGSVLFFPFSAKDVFATRDSILTQASKVAGFKVVIACLNSKLASVGTCLACFSNEELQLCYAQPERYNVTEFATPSDDVYIEELKIV